MLRVTGDVVNGAFEFMGAYVTLQNVLRTRQARAVVGVSWAAMGFFTFWGIWNMGFYPTLGLWWSFVGGTALAVANVWWMLLRWEIERGE